MSALVDLEDLTSAVQCVVRDELRAFSEMFLARLKAEAVLEHSTPLPPKAPCAARSLQSLPGAIMDDPPLPPELPPGFPLRRMPMAPSLSNPVPHRNASNMLAASSARSFMSSQSTELVIHGGVNPLVSINAKVMRRLGKDIARRHRRVSSNRICAPGRRAFFEGSRRTRAEDEEEDDDDGCFSRGRPLVVRVGRFVRKAVTSSFFDYMVCLALVVNSVLIGVEANYNAIHQPPPGYVKAFEEFFCVFFTLELALRMFAFRQKFLKRYDFWNYFDTVLVVLQIVDEIFKAATSDSDVSFGDIAVLRLARILKLLRILRLLRVIRFVSELRKVMYLIIGSIGSFVWTGVLLLLILYVLAVFFTQIVADYATKGTLSPEQAIHEETLRRYFGSTLLSLNSIYMAVMGGFSWEIAGRALIENISPVAGLVFALFIAFAVLVLLNLVTGVFVEGALRVSKADTQTELLERALTLFCRSDEDHSGEVSWDEFRMCLNSPEASRFFEALEISQDRAEDLFFLIDKSQDGKLSLEELVAGGLLLQGPARAFDVAVVAANLQTSLNAIMEQLDGRINPLGPECRAQAM